MTEPNERKGDAPSKGAIRCQRTDQEYDCSEHERCPYCFGNTADVRAGDHTKFCDYDPEKDPVSFGFRANSDRWEHG